MCSALTLTLTLPLPLALTLSLTLTLIRRRLAKVLGAEEARLVRWFPPLLVREPEERALGTWVGLGLGIGSGLGLGIGLGIGLGS